MRLSHSRTNQPSPRRTDSHAELKREYVKPFTPAIAARD
jgi:hypothetical protein